jgi:hypothetical protein
MSFVNLFEVDYKARGLMASEPANDYERWTLEIFRRRYAKAEADVAVAEAAFSEACKGGTFTKEEAAAHEKTLREAETHRSNSRAWISQLVSSAAGDLEFAKQKDKWAAADPEWRFTTLPGSAEEKRDAALQEATEQMKSDMDDVDQDEIGFSRGGRRRGGQGHKRVIMQTFEQRKAAIEEEYYAACT